MKPIFNKFLPTLFPSFQHLLPELYSSAESVEAQMEQTNPTTYRAKISKYTHIQTVILFAVYISTAFVFVWSVPHALIIGLSVIFLQTAHIKTGEAIIDNLAFSLGLIFHFITVAVVTATVAPLGSSLYFGFGFSILLLQLYYTYTVVR
jgi:hypothetical protein